MIMTFHQIDPIQDTRWSEFVDSHPKASIFHTVAWLQALRRTYGYTPVAFTTSPATSALKNGLLFCRINSWLTGSRLVSLPFSDHCDPLCEESEELKFLIRYLQTALAHQGWNYLEFRPIHPDVGEAMEKAELRRVTRNHLHAINLRRDIEELALDLANDSGEVVAGPGLVEKRGNSEQLVRELYNLFVASHAQHGFPSNPYAWFQNLRDCHGDSLDIRLASSNGRPLAALLTLRYKDTVYCNNGCSDPRFGDQKALPWLLWRTILAAKTAGAKEIEFGETAHEVGNLLTFANPWVLEKKRRMYWKYPEGSSLDSGASWKMKMAKKIYAHLPHKLQTFTGGMLYKHIG